MSGLEKGAGGLKIEGMMDGRESKTKNKWKFILGNLNRKKMDNVFDVYKLQNNS